MLNKAMSRALDLFVTLIFVAMALIQLNDPDPALWVLIYLGFALVALYRAIERRSGVLWGAALGLALAGLVLSFPGFMDFLHAGDVGAVAGEMSGDRPYIEPAREFLGTLIGCVSLVAYSPWHLGRMAP